jgi:oligoendopeptidase F
MKKPSNHPPEWDLKQIYPNEKTIQNDMDWIRTQTKAFIHYRKKLEHPTQELVEEIVHENERFAEKSHTLATYAMLAFSQNTLDEEAKARESKIDHFLTEQGNQRLFFGLWWKGLDEKTARKLLPRNKDHAHALMEMRKYAKHMLSEKEEQLANLKSTTGNSALVKLYDILTGDYTFEWKTGKKTRTLNEEELRTKVHHPNPRERERAYTLLLERFGKDAGGLGEIYKNIALDWWNEDIHLRKYDSPLSIRNLSNDLSDETVDTFLRVCEENTGVFQDYFAWKARELEHPLSRYHIYAPLNQPTKKWGFEEGYANVMNAYAAFSPRMKEEAHRVLKERRMDARLRKGKRGGAFCAITTPTDTSFVLLNWTGDLKSISTIAHELGHAIHNHYSSSHSIFTQHAGLPLAETASTFGEIVLDAHLLEENPSPSFRQHVLAKQMDDAFASIQRQSFFTLFEKEAFEMVREGKTIPELNRAYIQNLRMQFGKKMRVPEEFQYEWLAIHHFFHVPFYTYAYAFGHLLVLNFYARYQKEGKDFVKDYEKFLSRGGSENPEAMLREMGFDPSKRKSWENGFKLLRHQFEELKSF